MKTDKWEKALRCTLITIAVLIVLLVVNKLTVNHQMIANLFGIPVFGLMMLTAFLVFRAHKAMRREAIENVKVFDDMLLAKYYGQLRCIKPEPLTEDEKSHNMLFSGHIVTCDYCIAGELHGKSFEYRYPLDVYDNYAKSGAKGRIYYMQGSSLRYHVDGYRGCDIIIRTRTYRQYSTDVFNKNGYREICEFDDGSIVYVRNGSVMPDLKKLRQHYCHISEMTNQALHVSELLIFIHSGTLQLYVYEKERRSVELMERISFVEKCINMSGFS